MIIEIVIVVLVSIPSIIYAFRKIRKVKACCCSCEQDVQPDNQQENQPENTAEKLSLMQTLINRFTPRKSVAVIQSKTDVKLEMSQNQP